MDDHLICDFRLSFQVETLVGLGALLGIVFFRPFSQRVPFRRASLVGKGSVDSGSAEINPSAMATLELLGNIALS